jgi:hypothetical protein
MAAPAPYLVEEILEEILIRLPTPAALHRLRLVPPHHHRAPLPPPLP